MTELGLEVASTVRTAIAGWAPTVRLVVVVIVITICAMLVSSVR